MTTLNTKDTKSTKDHEEEKDKMEWTAGLKDQGKPARVCRGAGVAAREIVAGKQGAGYEDYAEIYQGWG
jgi:hypothetical protein